MKTLFSVGFESHNPFSVRHPSMGHAVLGQPQRVGLGDELDSGARGKMQTIITAGNTKLAQIRRWLTTQYAVDPTLLATFKEQYIVDNWRGYDEIVTKDQYYADLAAQKIASSDPINWDFTDETIERVNEWSQVIDIMYAGMQEYGGVGLPRPIKAGPMGPTLTTVKGGPIPSLITPGATLTTPPPSTGIPTNTLLIGGGIAAAALAVILAMKA